MVPGRPPRTRLPLPRLLRLERHRRAVPGRPHHLPRHRELQLDVGSGGQGLLLAPLLPPPARPQLRQPRGPPRAARRHALLDGQGPRRLPLRRGALSHRARGHQLREPARDPRLPARDPGHDRPRVPGAHSPGRGQPVARRRPPLLRRRRRVPHGLPLPADAPHVPGRPPRGPPPHHRHLPAHPGDPGDRPVVPLPAQPRRAHPRDGQRRGAAPPLLRLSRRSWRTTGGRSSC